MIRLSSLFFMSLQLLTHQLPLNPPNKFKCSTHTIFDTIIHYSEIIAHVCKVIRTYYVNYMLKRAWLNDLLKLQSRDIYFLRRNTLFSEYEAFTLIT